MRQEDNKAYIEIGRNSMGNYYVQTCCGEEHVGQECPCKSYGESYGIYEAKTEAIRLSGELALPIRSLIPEDNQPGCDLNWD